MKAAIRIKYGLPNLIKILPIDLPEMGDHDVLIKVYATTVNRTDCANLTAKPFIMRFVLGLFKPKITTLGTDFAGEIINIGKHVTNAKVGDRVFGFNDTGFQSQATHLCANSKEVYQIPNHLNYQESVASLEGAHYAYTFIKKTNIQPGQSILINGATGAIGSALLQFVRQYDVKITATCKGENIEQVKSLGAQKLYDYTKEDFTKSKETYDYIFDAVGKSTFGQCKPILKKNGTYISSELGPYNQNIWYALSTKWSNKKVLFPIPDATTETIPYIITQLNENNFKPLIDRVYSLDEIAKAYDYVLDGQKIGNVVITTISK